MSKLDTVDDVKWDDEHPLFKGTFFGKWKCGRKKYTLARGRTVGGGYSIGGTIDGEYQEIDVQTAEDMNNIMAEIQQK